MAPDLVIHQATARSQLTDLKRVSRREHNAMSTFLEFPDDRFEKWNVRRVVQVNPDDGLASGYRARGYASAEGL